MVVGEDFKGDLTLAYERAKEKALRSARLKARIFVRIVTETHDLVVTEDEISTILANRAEVRGKPEYKVDQIGNGAGVLLTCKLNAIVDDTNVLDAFKDREHLEQSVQNNKGFEEQRKLTEEEYDNFQKRYIETKDPVERKKIREQMEKNDVAFTVKQYFYSGNRFYYAKMYAERSRITKKHSR